ncbi:hypothetical protein A5892_11745 [Halotalea alkalilenta]|uniref:Uncharacterized protein n=1 Tax=Halotalea alkalilenta TaxID=376489 RepID=A0A172YG21_9GAMM|nr:hypothetical protein A5892_11745 [Halotalea alkalilenta]
MPGNLVQANEHTVERESPSPHRFKDSIVCRIEIVNFIPCEGIDDAARMPMKQSYHPDRPFTGRFFFITNRSPGRTLDTEYRQHLDAESG